MDIDNSVLTINTYFKNDACLLYRKERKKLFNGLGYLSLSMTLEYAMQRRKYN